MPLGETGETAVQPAIGIDAFIPLELGISVEVDTDTLTRVARTHKMSDTAIRATLLHVSSNTVMVLQNGKYEPLGGNVPDEAPDRINLYMGSIVEVARRMFEKGTSYSIEEVLSIIASKLLAHELSHAADEANMSSEELDKEDKAYNRGRLRRAILPRAGALMGMAALTGTAELGVIFMHMPDWLKLALGVIGGLEAGRIARDTHKAVKKIKNGDYTSDNKVYRGRPREARAFASEEAYRAKQKNGELPLLVKVSVIRPGAFGHFKPPKAEAA
jgi:hypothetical protein